VSRPLSPFEVLAVQSHAELLEEAVQVRLEASAELTAIVGESIPIVVDPLTRPEGVLPMLTIFTPNETRNFELNAEAEVIVPLGVGVLFSETRYYRERGEKSVKSLVNLIIAVLMADQRLDTAPLGPGNEFGLPDSLAESIRRVNTIDYGAVSEELNDDDEVISADLFRIVTFDYAYAVQQVSGVQA
jgi:hypothetical protein